MIIIGATKLNESAQAVKQ